MTVTDTNVVDVVSMPRGGTEVVLTITDHLEWTDAQGHLVVLQRKLDRYLDFIQSGELDSTCPQTVGKQPCIRIAFRHSPPEGMLVGELARVVEHVGALGVRLTWSMFHAG